MKNEKAKHTQEEVYERKIFLVGEAHRAREEYPTWQNKANYERAKTQMFKARAAIDKAKGGL